MKERSTYQRRRYEEKQREKKLSIRKHNIPRFGLRGLSYKRREELPEGRDMSTKIERQSIWHRYIYGFEPIPDKIRL
jgi:hypothetical protein